MYTIVDLYTDGLYIYWIMFPVDVGTKETRHTIGVTSQTATVYKSPVGFQYTITTNVLKNKCNYFALLC